LGRELSHLDSTVGRYRSLLVKNDFLDQQLALLPSPVLRKLLIVEFYFYVLFYCISLMMNKAYRSFSIWRLPRQSSWCVCFDLSGRMQSSVIAARQLEPCSCTQDWRADAELGLGTYFCRRMTSFMSVTSAEQRLCRKRVNRCQ
jgi:hypothetical protein